MTGKSPVVGLPGRRPKQNRRYRKLDFLSNTVRPFGAHLSDNAYSVHFYLHLPFERHIHSRSNPRQLGGVGGGSIQAASRRPPAAPGLLRRPYAAGTRTVSDTITAGYDRNYAARPVRLVYVKNHVQRALVASPWLMSRRPTSTSSARADNEGRGIGKRSQALRFAKILTQS